MRYSAQVKPISYLKAHAAEILLDLADRREPMVIADGRRDMQALLERRLLGR